MEIESDVQDNFPKKFNGILERLKATREKMEIEALVFIEVTKKFTFKWVQKEIEVAVNSPESATFPENLRLEDRKPGESNFDLKELPLKISNIVETHLNHGDYWIHRNTMIHPDISRDYVEFKREKIRKDLASSVRVILGCATEIFWELEEEEPENKVWVKELGRRKYACFLRFSDEMTASLNHYLELLEELFILSYEMKEENLKIERKEEILRIEKKT